MAQPTFPGVFIREVSSGVRTITGVATSIAAFVGMAKRGQINEPTRVLGFTDYSRIFLDDSSLGEMTAQVRQFFQNGGQQAFIVRVANNPVSAHVDLVREDGTPAFTLDARDPGATGNDLRVRVDYNTASPERTFNMTIYRETFNASGQTVAQDVETHSLLSMDPSSSRYVKTVLEGASQLARVHEPFTAPTAGPAAESISGRLFGTALLAEGAFLAAIQNTLPGGLGTEGRFRIRVGGSPFVTVSLPVSPAPTLASITTRINDQLTPHGVSIAALAVGGDQTLRFIASATGKDVVIESEGQSDIAAALGLGTANGGIEIGAFAAARPRPSGLVSKIDGAAAHDIDRLLDTAGVTKASVTTASINVILPFGPAGITFPAGGPNLGNGPIDATASLRNLRTSLQAIVQAINTGTDWRAELHGYRIAIFATFGSASSGAGATFSTGAVTNLGASTFIFNTITGRVQADALALGNDGTAPTRANYTDAFDALKEKVDLFNILVLPRTFDLQPAGVERRDMWGQASAFAQSERAFLLVDADPDINEVTEIEQEILNLRAGVQKDFAAVYWPRVTVVDSSGARVNIDPSGSVAGVMARTDASRGVWKAPAGLEAAIRAVSGVETRMSEGVDNTIGRSARRSLWRVQWRCKSGQLHCRARARKG